MSVLSDRDILEKWDKLFPYTDKNLAWLQNRIQPASVDLQLDKTLKNINGETFTLDEKSMYVLQPGEFILGSTIEYVTIPQYIVARVEGRSSVGRLGVMVHVTAGYIDPGFIGNITLELFNCNGRYSSKMIPTSILQASSPSSNNVLLQYFSIHSSNASCTIIFN